MGDFATAAAGLEAAVTTAASNVGLVEDRVDRLAAGIADTVELMRGLEGRVAGRLAAMEARLAALEAPPSGPKPPPARVLRITRAMTAADMQREINGLKAGETAVFEDGGYLLAEPIYLERLAGVTLRAAGVEAFAPQLSGLGRPPFALVAAGCRDLTIDGLWAHGFFDSGVFVDDACERVTLRAVEASDCATGVRIEGRDVTCERVRSHDNARMVAIGAGDAGGEHGAQAFCVAGTRERPNLGPVRLIDCEGWNNIARDPRISYGGHDGAEVELFHAQNVEIVRYNGRAGEVFIEAAGSTAGVRVRGGVIRDMNLFSLHQADDFKATGIQHDGHGPNWPLIWIGGGGVFGSGATAGFEFAMNYIRTPGTVWQLVGALDSTAVLSDNDYTSGGLFGLVGKVNAPTLADWQRLTNRDANSTWKRA